MTDNKSTSGTEFRPEEQIPSGERIIKQLALRSPFPNIIDFLVFFGIFFVSQLLGGVTALLFGAKMPDTALLNSTNDAVRTAEQLSVAHFNALSFFIAMSLTLVGFLLYRHRRHGPRIVARFSSRGLNPILLLWGVVFILATSVVLEPLMNMLPAIPNVYGRGAWSLITLVVMAPLFEEFIFRGIILESSRLRYGVVGAWLISAVVFGVAHLHPAVALNALVMGLVLGFIYIKSDSIWATIILHAINNGIAYLVLVLGREDAMLVDLISSRTLYVTIYIFALVLFLASGYMVYRVLARLKDAEKNQLPA